ncbi:MAG: hypothetical protein P8P91_11805 [Pseudomonadales bacterium]|nr:hypothetical protein [Pseudomonadales bacterium]
MSEQTQAMLNQLDISVVSLHRLTIDHGRFDRLIEQPEVAMAQPDHWVFGHTG